MVAGHALGPHGPEVTFEPGPELLQAHDADANPSSPGTGGAAVARARRAYCRRMVPGTGSDTLDLVLQIGIALATVVLIVLLIRNYRGR